MAMTLYTPLGQTSIPGAYSSYTVNIQPSGLAASGIVTLIGEAASGPIWSLETDLDTNAFTPSQLSDVIAKYGSGRLVDAFRQCIGPCIDPAIPGSPSLIKIVKTNSSPQASDIIKNLATTTYGTLYAAIGGQAGNNFSLNIANAPAETPAQFTATFAPVITAATYDVRVNGSAVGLLSVAASTSSGPLPSAIVSSLNGLFSGIASGGVDRGLIAAVSFPQITVSNASGQSCTMTLNGTSSPAYWATAPVAGDTFLVLTTALASANQGVYMVNQVTSGNSVNLTKLADIGAVPGAITPPANNPVANVSTSDIKCFSPITVTSSAYNVDGGGKSIEIYQVTGSAVESIFYVPNTVTVSPALATSTTAALSVSAIERGVTTTLTRASDNTSYSFTTGGQIVLQMAYWAGTTGTVTINAGNISATVTGGAGTSIASTPLSNFPTINDLVAWINSHAGYSAKAFTAVQGTVSPLLLDQGTFGICTNQASTSGIYPGRIKADAFNYFAGVWASNLIQLGSNPVLASGLPYTLPVPLGGNGTASAGLPAPVTNSMFTGGSTLGTTYAAFTAAVDACQGVTTNFVVPLISQDSTADIAAGTTTSDSSYTVAAINAYTNTHCNFMSGFLQRANRQAFLSVRNTLTNDQNAAAQLNSARACMSFQDIKASGINAMGVSGPNQSGIVTFQPYMGAVTAAAAQAAGFYQAIFNKGINISGALASSGDFNYKSRGQIQAALNTGLLIVQPVNGFRWVSDQTTYGTDQNPIYNSIQAQYAADICALTLAQRMEAAYIGKSLANVNASLAAASIDLICKDLFALKLIASSDGAPKGYTNIAVNIVGPTMKVSLDLYIATALYFINISFSIQQITSSATA